MASDYSTLLEQIEEYFADLLIIQFRKSPVNRQFIKMLVDLIFCNCLGQQIYELTVNVEESIGAQLDVVGSWVGVDRSYAGEIPWDKVYFALPSYSTFKSEQWLNYQGPFSNYTNFTDLEGGFLTYSAYQERRTKMNEMSDALFRQIIQLKIIKNSIKCTMQNIDEAIYEWSDGQIYTTWDAMTLTYNYPTALEDIMILAQKKDVLPVPVGCELLVEEIVEDE